MGNEIDQPGKMLWGNLLLIKYISTIIEIAVGISNIHIVL